MKNYKPISILPTILKVIERIIFDQMHDYFHTNKLYFEGQYGFRKKHSTELAAVEMIDGITQELDKGKQITDQKAISNAFNNYFVNIGPNLAANIKLPNSKSFKNFLRNPTSHKFNLACTNKENILKIIDRLHPKNS